MSHKTETVEDIIEKSVKKIEHVGKFLRTKEDFLKWIKFFNTHIRLIKKYLKNKDKNIKNLNKLESNLAILIYYTENIKKNFKKQF